jgi:hypothetical protein
VRVANELEAMEQIGVLPNRWNGPIQREHLSEQRHAWTWEKNQTQQERLSQHDALAADLETVSIRHAESIDNDKTLQENIKALRSRQDTSISSKQEIKKLQKQIESEKEKRCALKIERSGIKNMMQELKDSGLNGSRINAHRPTSSTPQAMPTAHNSAQSLHSDIENSLPIVNPHLEVPCKFTILRISIFKYQLKDLIVSASDSESFPNNTTEDLAETSSTDRAQYFNQVYIPILENEPGPLHSISCSGASQEILTLISIGFNPFIQVQLEGSASAVAPEQQSQAQVLNFDPNGPGMGLDVDFNNFDLGDIDAINVGPDIADFGIFSNFDLDGLDVTNNSMNHHIANFGFKDDTELSLQVGPLSHDTFQDSLGRLRASYEKSDLALAQLELTLPNASEFNPGTSTHQEHQSNEVYKGLRGQKRKKTDEVDGGPKSHPSRRFTPKLK